MREREVDRAEPGGLAGGEDRAGDLEARSPGLLLDHLGVVPAQAGRGTERLGDRFLGREPGRRGLVRQSGLGRGERSEEQPSELQSLMRHSYAVFCVKTKTA